MTYQDNIQIVLFEQNLRIKDNASLSTLTDKNANTLPIFIYNNDNQSDVHPGGASKVFLHHALHALDGMLTKLYQSRLLVFKGSPEKILKKIAKSYKINTVHVEQANDSVNFKAIESLTAQPDWQDVKIQTHCDTTLLRPNELTTKEGNPYRVFTPFYKSALQLPMPDLPAPMPKAIHTDASKIDFNCSIDQLGLLPDLPWHANMMQYWEVSEDAAHAMLDQFIDEAIAGYKTNRDFPAIEGTSKLSPYLHFGLISPKQIYHRLRRAFSNLGNFTKDETGPQCYLRELYWREFAYYLLHHFPHTTHQPLNPRFENFPWAEDETKLRAWQRGQTGYPIVDAAMRQLWETGWMHNRLRMIVASFLVKNLRIHWLEGARWFADTLVDADLASNTLGWQWAGGCGADAAPYFRIFNPWTQAKKFDASASFMKKWVPELRDMDAKAIHSMDKAGSLFMSDYPTPIVDHPTSRADALAAFEMIKVKT